MGDIDLASELAVALAELSEAPQHVASPCPHACAESAVLAVALVEPSEAPRVRGSSVAAALALFSGRSRGSQCPASGASCKEEETSGGPEALLVSG